MKVYKGIGVSPGIAIGKVYVYSHKYVNARPEKISSVKAELKKFEAALKTSKRQIKKLSAKISRHLKKEDSKIIAIQMHFLEDEVFVEKVTRAINGGKSAVESVREVLQEYEEMLLKSEDEYFKDRSLDIKDVGYRIISNILGIKNELEFIDKDVILVANDLTPSDTALLDKSKVLGIVTDSGGLTSHTAILARALGIPAIIGLKDFSLNVREGDEVIIDSENATVILNPDDTTKAYYLGKKQEYEDRKKEILALKDIKAITRDGVSVTIDANIGAPEEVTKAIEYGAEGIGLFRTEFLYINRFELPSEEEQFEAYSYVVKAMKGKPVVIRTFDIGGDKDFPYLGLKKESNPYLGMRGLRFSLANIPMFITQLKAILRASAYGPVSILFPMVSDVKEVIKSKDILQQVKDELIQERRDFDKDVKIGIMIEVPSTALTVENFIGIADFFSIGTNDLTQYTLAVDRSNENVADYYIPLHPSVIKLIGMVQEVAKKNGKKLSLCGELAAFKEGIPVLLKQGIRVYSMSPASIPEVKKYIREITLEGKNIPDGFHQGEVDGGL
ncbi:phosphoenolpyruvate--protein phosphotransferase [Caldanaerobius polysaccharolyticus]|uniref:phosphoenolpyruvate--protein phosphotransferase n=1 Tax=Caldanaerobius polysaccharolyticus TaxID=44256 RepID=UPI00068EE505|nr:phosphoenolpyruvate--protein phosphotransferase [Caldanaerobius polysaccharolyticus]